MYSSEAGVSFEVAHQARAPALFLFLASADWGASSSFLAHFVDLLHGIVGFADFFPGKNRLHLFAQEGFACWFWLTCFLHLLVDFRTEAPKPELLR